MTKQTRPSCSIKLSEHERARLCLILGAINWMSILFSATLMSVGGYIRFRVTEFTNLVSNYDSDTLPYVLVGVGAISFLSNIIGGWLTFGSADPVRRRQYRFFLLAHIIFTLIISVAIFAGGIMCFQHIAHVNESFKGGLMKALDAYKTNLTIKMEVDKLQMGYDCCGNDEYADWFTVPWIDTAYINTKNIETLQGSAYTTDAVPFSCCDPKADRPCIHHGVRDNVKHYNYDWNDGVTIHTVGCRKALSDFLADELLTPCGGLIFGIFILNVVLAVAGRFLQTALSSSVLAEDLTASTYGYLLDVCGAQEDSKPEEEALLEEGEKEEQDSEEQGLGYGSQHVIGSQQSIPQEFAPEPPVAYAETAEFDFNQHENHHPSQMSRQSDYNGLHPSQMSRQSDNIRRHSQLSRRSYVMMADPVASPRYSAISGMMERGLVDDVDQPSQHSGFMSHQPSQMYMDMATAGIPPPPPPPPPPPLPF